ncbi:MAG: hypothetical protein DMG16_20810 [Acidobacteria bacterium]|nr:MAG: hypothetical protein DMG16_20810 [Acidobacteriota bacterium]
MVKRIPLLAEEGWREAPGWSVWSERFAGLLLRLPVGLALRASPSAPSLRSAQLLLMLRPIGLALRALLSEEGNFRNPCRKKKF